MKKNDNYESYGITILNPEIIMDTQYFDILSKLTNDGSLIIHASNGKIESGDVIAPYTFNSDEEAWAWIYDFWEPLQNGESNGSAGERAGDIFPFDDAEGKIRVKLYFDSMDDALAYYVETEPLRAEKRRL